MRLTGPYKRAAGGVNEFSLLVQSPTLAGVLDALTQRFPEAGRLLRPSPSEIEPAVRVVVNDVVLVSASPAHKVRDGDRVAFVPIVGGGCPSRPRVEHPRFWETFMNKLLLQ